MGQLGERYDDEDADDEAGLPGQLRDPMDDPPEGADDGLADGTAGEALYDLADWSDAERQEVADRLEEATIPFAWDGTTLEVAAGDADPVENILDIVDGGADGPEPLDPERDQVAYDMTEWEDDQLTRLADALAAAGIDYSWDSDTDELFVYAEHEEAVDELVDKVAHPDELDAEADDGAAGAEMLGAVFVAADRLQHDGGDTEGTIAMAQAALAVDAGEPPPYGVDPAQWKQLCERIAELGDLLSEDTVDQDEVQSQAGALRSALRPFV